MWKKQNGLRTDLRVRTHFEFMGILCTLAAAGTHSTMPVVSRGQGTQNLQLLVVGGHPSQALVCVAWTGKHISPMSL
jgi:hypothetical protein